MVDLLGRAAGDGRINDHDRSSGAVRVVEGALLEDVLAPEAGGRIGLQTVEHRAGGGFSFDATHIHDVRHDGGPAATSIHVYSPALRGDGAAIRPARGLGRVPLTVLTRSPRAREAASRADRHEIWQTPTMSSLIHRVVAEEHHLEDIARDGYAPATIAITLAGIVLALVVIVGLALGLTLAVYYLT